MALLFKTEDTTRNNVILRATVATSPGNISFIMLTVTLAFISSC